MNPERNLVSDQEIDSVLGVPETKEEKTVSPEFARTQLVSAEKQRSILQENASEQEVGSAQQPADFAVHHAENPEKRSAGIEPAYCLTGPDGSFTMVAANQGKYETIQEYAEAAQATMEGLEEKKPLSSLPSLAVDTASGGVDIRHLRAEAVDRAFVAAGSDLVARVHAREQAQAQIGKKNPDTTAYLLGRVYTERTSLPETEESGAAEIRAVYMNDAGQTERLLADATRDPTDLSKNFSWEKKLSAMPGTSYTERIQNLLTEEQRLNAEHIAEAESQLNHTVSLIEEQAGKVSRNTRKSAEKLRLSNLTALHQKTQESINSLKDRAATLRYAEVKLQPKLERVRTIRQAEGYIRKAQVTQSPEAFAQFLRDVPNLDELRSLDTGERRILRDTLAQHQLPTEELIGMRVRDELSPENQELLEVAVEEMKKNSSKLKKLPADEQESVFNASETIVEALPQDVRAALYQELTREEIKIPKGLERRLFLVPPVIPREQVQEKGAFIVEGVIPSKDESAAQAVLRSIGSHPELADKLVQDTNFQSLSATGKRAVARRLLDRELINQHTYNTLTERRVLKMYGEPKDQIRVVIVHGDGSRETVIRPQPQEEQKLIQNEIDLNLDDRVIVLHEGYEDTGPLKEDIEQLEKNIAQNIKGSPGMKPADISAFIKDRSEGTHLVIQPHVEKLDQEKFKKKKATRPLAPTVAA